jgi:hypothetical protein
MSVNSMLIRRSLNRVGMAGVKIAGHRIFIYPYSFLSTGRKIGTRIAYDFNAVQKIDELLRKDETETLKKPFTLRNTHQI